MTFLVIAFLVGFVAAIAIVLADSGLRLWSAFGGVTRERAEIERYLALPSPRRQTGARVLAGISCERLKASWQHAAA